MQKTTETLAENALKYIGGIVADAWAVKKFLKSENILFTIIEENGIKRRKTLEEALKELIERIKQGKRSQKLHNLIHLGFDYPSFQYRRVNVRIITNRRNRNGVDSPVFMFYTKENPKEISKKFELINDLINCELKVDEGNFEIPKLKNDKWIPVREAGEEIVFGGPGCTEAY